MGDMLEDVSRASYRVEDGNTGSGATPIVDILGAADGTTFFASPWGKGGNVTDFCYKAGSRTTTVATATGTANGCDAGGGGTAGQCTSGSVVVASLDDLGVVVGDYVQVGPSAANIVEYMKVTGIVPSTKTLTVIRNVAPNCLGYPAQKGTDWAIGATVTLLHPIYDTVQLVDSVTKFRAEQECYSDDATTAVLHDNANMGSAASVDTATAANRGVSNTLVLKGDAGNTGADLVARGLQVGGYVKVNNKEYMLVTGVNAAAHTITVTRYQMPPQGLGCTALTPDTWDGTHSQNVQVVNRNNKPTSSGSCAVVGPKMAEVNDGNAASGDGSNHFTADDSALTYDAADHGNAASAKYPFIVGEFINVGNEYMLVTGVVPSTTAGDKGTVNVIRDVNPPCLSSTGNAQHNDNADINKVVTGGCYAMPATTTLELKTNFPLAVGGDKITVAAATGMQVGGYLFIGTEYMLITDIDGTGDPYTVTVVRNVAPPCVVGTTTTTSTGASGAIAACANNACNNLFVLSLSSSNNMISTSMRAIVELSPREPIVWTAAAPAPPPSPHYVDLRVTMPYSLAEFNVPSVTEPFKRAIARVAGTTVDKIVLSFPAQRRAATDTLLVDVRILADSAAEVRTILTTLGADPDTLECASTCRAALLEKLNKELRAEGLREATAIEIMGSSVVATKKKTDDNMLLLLLLLLLIPIGAAVYWCCKQETVAPVGKPMAPVYLPQPYPVLEMSPQPVMMAPMPMVEMSPQPVMMAPMPMVEMSPQPVMMAPMGMQPPMPAPAQPMQYGM